MKVDESRAPKKKWNDHDFAHLNCICMIWFDLMINKAGRKQYLLCSFSLKICQKHHGSAKGEAVVWGVCLGPHRPSTVAWRSPKREVNWFCLFSFTTAHYDLGNWCSLCSLLLRPTNSWKKRIPHSSSSMHFLFFSSKINDVPISSSSQTWQWKTNHLVPWMSQKNQGIFGDTVNYVH